MTDLRLPTDERPQGNRLLEMRLSGLSCLIAWILATAIFFGCVALFGGPSENDATESAYGSWAIAHGVPSCSYSPLSSVTHSYLPEYGVGPRTAPLWPLLSGGLAALTRIGHRVPFPSQEALGVGCATAYQAMYGWAEDARVLLPTTGLGYVSWFALLAGVVALVRAAGRGRRVWEAFAVILVALSPTVWMPLLDYYHPEDILALGLILAGMACMIRREWIVGGVLFGLAVTSQQFALLALLPLLVVVSGRPRWKLLISSGVTWLVIVLPLVAVTSGRAFGSAVYGTGDGMTLGGTVLWETGLRGQPLAVFARGLPIVVAVGIAWWGQQRKGQRMLEPVPMVALIAVTLSLRIVFEQGLFGYKFMVLSVMLIMLGVVRGRVPAYLIGWIALTTLAFNPIPWGVGVNARSWGGYAATTLEVFCMAATGLVIALDLGHRRRVRWYLVAGLVLAICAFGQWPPIQNSLRQPLPLWFWQVLLVGSGVAMAATPLVKFVRSAESGAEPRVWSAPEVPNARST
jgi:hypothetical protein